MTCDLADNGGDVGKPPPPPPNNGTISDKALEYKLVDLMKDEAIGDTERSAIWTLIQYLTAKSKTQKRLDDLQ